MKPTMFRALPLLLCIAGLCLADAATANARPGKKSKPPPTEATSPLAWSAPAPGQCNYSEPGIKHCTVDENAIFEVRLSQLSPTMVKFEEPAEEIMIGNQILRGTSTCFDEQNNPIPKCRTSRIYFDIDRKRLGGKKFPDGLTATAGVGNITITLTFGIESPEGPDAQLVIHSSERLKTERRCAEREADTLKQVEDAKARVFEDAKRLADEHILELAIDDTIDVRRLRGTPIGSGDRIILAAQRIVRWGTLSRLVTFSVENRPYGNLSQPTLHIDKVEAFVVRDGSETSVIIDKRVCKTLVVPAKTHTTCTLWLRLDQPPGAADRLRIRLQDTHTPRTATLRGIPL